MKDTYTDQLLNINSIQRFLARKESIFLFLVLTFAITILLVVFGQPTAITVFTTQQTALSPIGQIAITFTTGFVTLALSRIALSLVIRHSKDIQPAALLIWIIGELVLCISVMSLVLWALSGAGKVALAPLVGSIVLGYIGVLSVPCVVTYLIYRLHESDNEIKRLRQENQSGVVGQTAQDTTINFYGKGGKLAFSTKLDKLLYVEAADNYVNIHYVNSGKEDTFILLNTLKNIEKNFSLSSLIRCHRCYIVNAENVKLMRKENSGLVLELNYCQKVIPVSKSFAEAITHYFAYNTNFPMPE